MNFLLAGPFSVVLMPFDWRKVSHMFVHPT